MDFSRGSFSKFPFSFSKSGPRGCLYCFVRCAILVNAVFVLEKTFSDLENAPPEISRIAKQFEFPGWPGSFWGCDLRAHCHRAPINRPGRGFGTSSPGRGWPPNGIKDKTKCWEMPSATNVDEDERSTQQPVGALLDTASVLCRRDVRACITTYCGLNIRRDVSSVRT